MSESILGPPPILEEPRDGLAAYAVSFHEALGEGHVAASPLGAYLLLAAAASAAEGPARDDLEAILGCSVEHAGEFLAGLLAEVPSGLQLALGSWHDPSRVNEAFADWYASLPSGFERGPIPSQADVDRWARLATGGQVESFPLSFDPLTAIMFASALSTKSRWRAPFDVMRSTGLGPTCFTGVRWVLRGWGPGERAIAWTESAGLVGTCVAETFSDLRVVSVIAEPTVPPHRVMAAAHEVAALASERRSTAGWRSLFDLPLGAGHCWDLIEGEFPAPEEGQRQQLAEVQIPAWEASATALDLMSLSASGFGKAAGALARLIREDQLPLRSQAAQSTTARFDRNGFSAASVTAYRNLALCGAARPKARGLQRLAVVRFAHPFAVVATPRTPSAWNGVPVFSAWVTRAIEPATE